MEYLWVALFVVIMVVGLLALLGNIDNCLYGNSDIAATITVLKLRGSEKNIEYIVRNLIAGQSCSTRSDNYKIILLDRGADDETMHICNYLCEELPCVTLCKDNEFEQVMRQKIS